MTFGTPNFEATVERVNKLEKANRRLKRVGVTVLAMVGVLAVMGQAAPKSRVVEAEKFVLRDASGRIRAKLYTDDDSLPVLALLDAEGYSRALLSVDKNGGNMLLSDAKGKLGVQLATIGDDRRLCFYSAQGRGGLVLSTGKGQKGDSSSLLMYGPEGMRVSLADSRTDLGTVEYTSTGKPTAVREWKLEGPSLQLYDSQHYGTKIGVTSLLVPSSGETRTTSAASVVMLDTDKKVIWSAP